MNSVTYLSSLCPEAGGDANLKLGYSLCDLTEWILAGVFD